MRPSTRHETLAITFLLCGGILIIAGWFIGIALLWTSHKWQLRDKLIGTFLLPGGLLFALVLYLKETLVFGSTGTACTSQVSPPGPTHCITTTYPGHTLDSPATLALLVVAVLIPTVSAAYLNRRRRIQAH